MNCGLVAPKLKRCCTKCGHCNADDYRSPAPRQVRVPWARGLHSVYDAAGIRLGWRCLKKLDGCGGDGLGGQGRFCALCRGFGYLAWNETRMRAYIRVKLKKPATPA